MIIVFPMPAAGAVVRSKGPYRHGNPVNLSNVRLLRAKQVCPDEQTFEPGEGTRFWMQTVYEAKQTSRKRGTSHALALWKRAANCSVTGQQEAYSLSQAALIYYQQKKYEESEALCLRALSIYMHDKNATSEDLATALNNIALLYQSMFRFDEAARFYQKSLDIRLKILDVTDPVMLSLLTRLRQCMQQAIDCLNLD